MEKIIDKVQRLTQQIDDAEKKKSRVEGRLEEQTKQLKELTGTEKTEEAKDILQDMTSDLEKTEKKIREKFGELESEYDFD